MPSDKSRVSGIGHYAILRDFLLILRRFVGLILRRPWGKVFVILPKRRYVFYSMKYPDY